MSAESIPSQESARALTRSEVCEEGPYTLAPHEQVRFDLEFEDPTRHEFRVVQFDDGTSASFLLIMQKSVLDQKQ